MNEMKKTSYFIFIVLLALTACDKDSLDSSSSFDTFLDNWEPLKSYQNGCISATDAIKYPEPWTLEVAETFVISDETILSMSTCGLLQTWLDYPPRALGPWCTYCSNLNLPGITIFNNDLQADNIAMELVGRNDCVTVLMSKYLSIIKTKEKPSGKERTFEMLLASDICMSVLNEKEKILFMAMALEKMSYETDPVNETCHIMVAIMQACNFTPFLEEVGKNLRETMLGYTISNASDGLLHTGLGDFSDIIEKYAKQFLNEQN